MMLLVISNFLLLLVLVIVYFLVLNSMKIYSVINPFVLEVYIYIVSPLVILITNLILYVYFGFSLYLLISTLVTIIPTAYCIHKTNEKNKNNKIQKKYNYQVLHVVKLALKSLDLESSKISVNVKYNYNKKITAIVKIDLDIDRNEYGKIQKQLYNKINHEIKDLEIQILFNLKKKLT